MLTFRRYQDTLPTGAKGLVATGGWDFPFCPRGLEKAVMVVTSHESSGNDLLVTPPPGATEKEPK